MADTEEIFGCYVTRKAGPARADGGSRVLVELSAGEGPFAPEPIELTRDQAVAVGVALIKASR